MDIRLWVSDLGSRLEAGSTVLTDESAIIDWLSTVETLTEEELMALGPGLQALYDHLEPAEPDPEEDPAAFEAWAERMDVLESLLEDWEDLMGEE